MEAVCSSETSDCTALYPRGYCCDCRLKSVEASVYAFDPRSQPCGCPHRAVGTGEPLWRLFTVHEAGWVHIKIARDKGREIERETEVGSARAKGNSPCVCGGGGWGAGLQEKSLRLPWLPERSVCNELRLILWSVGLDDQSARGNRRAHMCLWAVYGAGVLATLRCKYCVGCLSTKRWRSHNELF
jgi:hypothetical protein